MNQGSSGELELRGLRKAYGSFNAVDGVDLRVREGEFVSLLGPSGCGKTTILRMVAGLIEPDNGQILLGGDDITRRAVHRRNVGLVFQSYALFPHLNVFENVAFGLRRRGVEGAEIKTRVERFLGLVQLDRHGARYPRELSGGQQQRVALARALVTRPGLLLLDEPLSNLDALLRDEMRLELKRLQEELGTTTVFVTHDQAEALTLSDRVAVLSQGRIEQFDTPENVLWPAFYRLCGWLRRTSQPSGRHGQRAIGFGAPNPHGRRAGSCRCDRCEVRPGSSRRGRAPSGAAPPLGEKATPKLRTACR